MDKSKCVATTSPLYCDSLAKKQLRIWQALGFLHSRTNLSPFTKDFRGEGQLDEYSLDFSLALLRRGSKALMKAFDYLCHLTLEQTKLVTKIISR